MAEPASRRQQTEVCATLARESRDRRKRRWFILTSSHIEKMIKGFSWLARWCAVILLLCDWALSQSQSSNLRDDTQFWSSLQLSTALSQKIDLILMGSLRVGDAVSRLVYQR